MSMGNRIRLARERAGLTQRQLGEKLNMPFQSISQWERGSRNPKLATLEKIADALDISVSELIDNETSDVADGGRIEPDIIYTDTGSEYIQYELPLPDGRQITIQIPSYDHRLQKVWNMLNSDGKNVALERLWELAQIPGYQQPKERLKKTGERMIRSEAALGKTSIMERIGDFVKSAREEMSLTQQELGEKCGISAEAVMQYESGMRFTVDPAILQRICNTLGLDMKAVLDLTDDEINWLEEQKREEYLKSLMQEHKENMVNAESLDKFMNSEDWQAKRDDFIRFVISKRLAQEDADKIKMGTP